MNQLNIIAVIYPRSPRAETQARAALADASRLFFEMHLDTRLNILAVLTLTKYEAFRAVHPQDRQNAIIRYVARDNGMPVQDVEAAFARGEVISKYFNIEPLAVGTVQIETGINENRDNLSENRVHLLYRWGVEQTVNAGAKRSAAENALTVVFADEGNKAVGFDYIDPDSNQYIRSRTWAPGGMVFIAESNESLYPDGYARAISHEATHVLLSVGGHPYDGVPQFQHIFSYGNLSGWQVSSNQRGEMIRNITNRPR
jgi:hypothetical protein